MVMTKLTIIGAGSTVFTKNIVVDLLTIDQFKSIEIALMDIDQNRLIKAYLKRKADRVLLDPRATFVEREVSYKQYIVELYNFLLKSVKTHLKAINERNSFSST